MQYIAVLKVDNWAMSFCCSVNNFAIVILKTRLLSLFLIGNPQTFPVKFRYIL